MQFSGEITVEAPRDAVWDKVRDARFFVFCIEGVRDLEEIDDTHYKAVMESKVAYIKLTFEVEVEVVKSEPPHLIEAKVEGRPLKLVGRIAATSTVHLEEAGAATKIRYETELSLTGKLGSLGRPALTAKAKEMEKMFARNLQDAFAEAAG